MYVYAGNDDGREIRESFINGCGTYLFLVRVRVFCFSFAFIFVGRHRYPIIRSDYTNELEPNHCNQEIPKNSRSLDLQSTELELEVAAKAHEDYSNLLSE